MSPVRLSMSMADGRSRGGCRPATSKRPPGQRVSATTPMTRLFSTAAGLVLENDGSFFAPANPLTLDAVFQSADPVGLIRSALSDARRAAAPSDVHAPLQSQEIWA